MSVYIGSVVQFCRQVGLVKRCYIDLLTLKDIYHTINSNNAIREQFNGKWRMMIACT